MTSFPKFLWDDCNSIEEQRARVFRRWLADPSGRYDERWDNEKLVKLAIEFWVQSLFRRSPDQRIHEYWSDGIYHLECWNRQITNLRFSGTSIFSDRFANREWFAPFELDVHYPSETANAPRALSLRFGERDPVFPIAKVPLGDRLERKQTALSVHTRRPTEDCRWAISLTFDPYEG